MRGAITGPGLGSTYVPSTIDTMLVPSAYIYTAIALGAKHGRTAGRAREAWYHVGHVHPRSARGLIT